MNKLRRAFSLSGRDWRLLIEVWLGLLVTDLALRSMTLPQVRRRMAVEPSSSCFPMKDACSTHRLLHLIDIAARHHLYPMRCLTRSLVLQRCLGRRGIRSDLRIGVLRSGDELKAHAWLEYRGKPVGERPDIARSFAPLNAVGAEG